MKHSPLGIASACLIAVVVACLVGIGWSYHFIRTTPPGGAGEWRGGNHVGPALLILLFCVIILHLCVVGFILGLIGLFQRDRRRGTAVAGAALHPLALGVLAAAILWAFERGEKKRAGKAAAVQAEQDETRAAEADKWNKALEEQIRKIETAERLKIIHFACEVTESELGRRPKNVGDITPLLGRGWNWVGKNGGWTSEEQRLRKEDKTELLTSLGTGSRS